MGLVQARGKDVVNAVNSVDVNKSYIRLKDREAVRVRVLSASDFIQYKAHGSFTHKVYTQPCIAPLGQECPLCVASKSGVDDFDQLYAKNRCIFAFGDIDTGELKVWECSRDQAKALINQIEEYKEDLSEYAFNFKRSGIKTDTVYTLNLIPKLKAEDLEKFRKFDGETVSEEFYESMLVPRTPELMKDILYNAGFPVTEYYPDFVPTQTTQTE